MRQAVKKGGVEDSYVLGFGVMGLWGYITSYKGISTNFVLREPSVYQNISDCLFYNQKAC